MRKNGRVLALALVAGTLGYFAAPQVAHAATVGLTKIVSGSKSSQLTITGGKAKVDTEATTESFTAPPLSNPQSFDTFVNGGFVQQIAGGALVFQSGTGSSDITCSSGILVDSIVADGTGGSSVTITGDANGDGSTTDLLWKWAGPGHANDTFDGGLISFKDLHVATTGTVTWILYGLNFCTLGGSRAVAQRVRAGSIGR